jgi:hypothetical protein
MDNPPLARGSLLSGVRPICFSFNCYSNYHYYFRNLLFFFFSVSAHWLYIYLKEQVLVEKAWLLIALS